jgi:lysophospholipase L1-like esterase
LRSLAGWRGRAITRTIEAAADEAGVRTVPLARLTGRFFGDDPTHYSEDLFHPGPLGYRRWAEAIYPYLEAELRSD